MQERKLRADLEIPIARTLRRSAGCTRRHGGTARARARSVMGLRAHLPTSPQARQSCSERFSWSVAEGVVVLAALDTLMRVASDVASCAKRSERREVALAADPRSTNNVLFAWGRSSRVETACHTTVLHLCTWS